MKTGFPAGWQRSRNQKPSQQILTFTSGAISSSFCPPLISNILEAHREISLKPVSEGCVCVCVGVGGLICLWKVQCWCQGERERESQPSNCANPEQGIIVAAAAATFLDCAFVLLPQHSKPIEIYGAAASNQLNSDCVHKQVAAPLEKKMR